MNEVEKKNTKRRIRYLAFDIALLQLLDEFALDARREMTKYCRISAAKVLDEVGATERTESRMGIHLELRPN